MTRRNFSIRRTVAAATLCAALSVLPASLPSAQDAATDAPADASAKPDPKALPLPEELPPLDLERIYNPEAASANDAAQTDGGESGAVPPLGTPTSVGTSPTGVLSEPVLKIVTPKVNPIKNVAPLDIPLDEIPNYRQYVRDILVTLVQWSKPRNGNFKLIVADGFDLFVRSKREWQLDEIRDPEGFLAKENGVVGSVDREYLATVDGVLVSGVYCGTMNVSLSFLNLIQNQRKTVLTTDHCGSDYERDQALEGGKTAGYVPHADLDKTGSYRVIPSHRPVTESPDNIYTLNDAHNMLINLDAGNYRSKEEWVTALTETSYDLLVMDPFYDRQTPVTHEDVYNLKFKRVGAKRLVFARMQVTRADDTRFYWRSGWMPGTPPWLGESIEGKPGRYYTQYWDPLWKETVGRIFAGIMDLGFDGVVIEGLDGYRYWEARTPLK